MTEDIFFKSTPKKVLSLWKIHARFNGLEIADTDEVEKRVQFIDEIPFL